MPEIIFHGILKAHGWLPGRREAGGKFVSCHYKRFPEADLTAVVEHEYAAGGLRMPRAYFLKGFPEWKVTDRSRSVLLGKVEAVTLSEVIGTLAVLASKGV